MKEKILFVTAAFLISGRAEASVTVQAQLSQSTAQVGDILDLTVRAVATVNAEVSFDLPDFSGFTVLSQRQSTQMSMSLSFGKQAVRREQILNMELSVNKPGTQVIPPIVAAAGGFKGQSKPITLEVGALKPLAPSAADAGKVAPPDQKEQSLFLRYRVDKSVAWLGEQILLDLEIFVVPRTRLELESIDEPPDVDGFWKEVISKESRPSKRLETVNGRSYEVYRIWRVALFGVKAGNHILEPSKAMFRVGGGGFFSTQKARRSTKALTVEIKPLPEPAPTNFSTANVGTLALTAQVDRTQITDGKAAVFKLSLSGEGNVKGIKLPELSGVDGFRVFPPTESEDIDLRPVGVHGTKVSETLLVPQTNGKHRIPPLKLPIFDPRKGAYQTLETNPIELTVDRLEEASLVQTPPSSQEKSTPLPKTDRPVVRMKAKLQTPPSEPYRSYLWWSLILSMPLVVTASSSRKLILQLKPRAKGKDRYASLSQAMIRGSQAAQNGDAGTAALAFIDLVYEQVALSHSLEIRGRTIREAVDSLIAQGVLADIAEGLGGVLEEASFLRYGGGQSDALASNFERWKGALDAAAPLAKAKRIQGARS